MSSKVATAAASKAAIGKPSEDADSGPKPLAATLLQEFQNLKDKFKNEDDDNDKGKIFLH